MRTEIELLCLSRQEKTPRELSKFKFVVVSGNQTWGAKRSEIWCSKAQNKRPTTTQFNYNKTSQMQTKIKANSARKNEDSWNAARGKRKCGRQISNAYVQKKH